MSKKDCNVKPVVNAGKKHHTDHHNDHHHDRHHDHHHDHHDDNHHDNHHDNHRRHKNKTEKEKVKEKDIPDKKHCRDKSKKSNSSKSDTKCDTPKNSSKADAKCDTPKKSGDKAPDHVINTCSNDKIALLLPEDKTSRYNSIDLPNFETKLNQLCFKTKKNFIYLNAKNDSNLQIKQANIALNKGAKVLVVDPVDSNAASAIASQAFKLNVPIISYDRLIRNLTSSDYYISFDNTYIGQLQAQSLIDKLYPDKKNLYIVMINGDVTNDNNAVLLKNGALEIFNKYKVQTESYDIPNWDKSAAEAKMTEVLKAHEDPNLPHIDAVLVANDNMAGGVINAYTKTSTAIVPITGQDGDPDAFQRIKNGSQFMTVYKDVASEAITAANLAFNILHKCIPLNTINSITGSTLSVLLKQVQVVTSANVNDYL